MRRIRLSRLPGNRSSPKNGIARNARFHGETLRCGTPFAPASSVGHSFDAAQYHPIVTLLREPKRSVTGRCDQRHEKGEIGWGARIRTWECRYQKPMPYHLAMPQPAPRDAERAKYPTPSGDATGQCGRCTDEMHTRFPVPCRGSEKSADKHACGALRGCKELAISRASVRSVAQPGRALSS